MASCLRPLHRSIALRGVLAATLLSLGACSYLPAMPTLPSFGSADSFLGFITPYRIEIVQGNVVTREQAGAIKPGMTRNQVRDILGSPMLADPFHTDRWDYVFTIRRAGTELQRRSVVVRFKEDKLDSLEGSDLPSEQEFVAAISRPLSGGRGTAPLDLTDAQRQALPKPAPVEATPTTPIGAVRSYPPLEPS